MDDPSVQQSTVIAEAKEDEELIGKLVKQVADEASEQLFQLVYDKKKHRLERIRDEYSSSNVKTQEELDARTRVHSLAILALKEIDIIRAVREAHMEHAERQLLQRMKALNVAVVRLTFIISTIMVGDLVWRLGVHYCWWQ
jgi:hypothetical protein